MSSATHEAERPTRVRYRVLALVCTLSMITYLDRVCFGAALATIARELNLADVSQLKWALTSFMIAYALFEIPTGWLGDVFGPRKTLIRIVLWWSAFTALTGMVGLRVGGVVLGGVGMMVVLRFLFGAGEAGAYPNITRVVHNWFPRSEWETAQGMVWMSGRLMGGITPFLWMVLVAGDEALTTWRGAFLLFGAVGVAWCIVFAIWFRSRPSDHPAVNAAERALIGEAPSAESHASVPWRKLIANRSVVALCLMYALVTYGWVFNISYLPNYILQRFNLKSDNALAAIYAGAPLWFGALGCLLGGTVITWVSRRVNSRATGRRLVCATSLAACALCWVGAIFAGNVHLFAACIASAAFCIDLTLGAAWATCQDIGQKYAAVTAATMNMIGTFGAAIATWSTGTIVERAILRVSEAAGVAPESLADPERYAASMGGYQLVFVTYAAAYVVAALCWLVIDPARKLSEE